MVRQQFVGQAHSPKTPGVSVASPRCSNRDQAEAMLRDMAYVLHLTQKVRKELEASSSCVLAHS